MNQFTQSENTAASLVLIEAQRHANSYAQPGDRQAATIALLMRALELAGGAFLLKENEDE
jgi:flagellar basal body P-ring protein FlgI